MCLLQKGLPIAFIFFFQTALSQHGSIGGQITTNKLQGAPFVKVFLENTSFGVLTDQEGFYLLENIPAGAYKLVARSTGMAEKDTSIQVLAGKQIAVNINLDNSDNILNEVVVTGTLKEISRMESPVSIEVITPALFQKSPSPTIFESLSMVNGVRPQLQCNVCNTGDIHINGMEGPYTMVMIDGMPIVSALGTVYGLMGIPNSLIERVEVQKGPASTLYGSEAVGGLINVITKSPQNAPPFSFDYTMSTYQDMNLDFGITYKIGKSVSALFSGNVFYFDKKWDINGDNFTDVTLQKRYAGFNKFSFAHKTGKTSNLAIRYFYEDRWGGQLNWNENWRGGDSIYGESIYTNRLELIGNSPFALLGKNTKLQYSYNLHHQNSAYGSIPYLATQHISFVQITKNISVSKHDFLLGTALRYTYYDDNTVITQSHDTLNPVNSPSKTFLPGIFFQDEFKINSKHTLLGGIRYDFNSNHGHVVSPRLNWKWILNKSNIVRLGLGNGYRVVNLFSEDHAAFSGAREVILSEELKPEQSWNATLNLSSFLNLKSGFINIESSFFYTYFSNKIAADYFTNPNQIIFTNLNGYGITRGIGVMAHGTFIIPLKIILGATYTDVHLWIKNQNDILVKSEQVHTPPLTTNFVVGYTFTKIKLSLDITGNVYSPMLLPVLPNDYRPSHSPWFTLVNFQILKDFDSGLKLYAGVKNLFNFVPSEDPIMRPFDPFDKTAGDPVKNPNGYTFDPGYNYAPLQGARVFAGLRYALKSKK